MIASLLFFHKTCTQKAGPAEKTDDPVLAAEHRCRHQIQQILEAGTYSSCSGSHNIDTEYHHRQYQGAKGYDPDPPYCLFVFFTDAHHQQTGTGDEENQSRQHKEDLADAFDPVHTTQSHTQNV